MSEHIPAWKRIGLKVKEELEHDPLALTTHLDTGKLTKKQQKKINNKRARGVESEESQGEKKAPKRQKLPKGERPPPPEKDQLVYLKTYTTDRENWKFSKQKQNWVLKHVKVIEPEYEEYLINYFAGLQGGGKDRMARILGEVCESWNKLQDEELSKPKPDETEDAKVVEKEDGKRSKPKKKDLHDELTSVDADYAMRAQKILKAMTGEAPELKGIDDENKVEEIQDGTSEAAKEKDEETINKEQPESVEEEPQTLTQEPSKANDTSNLILESVEVSDYVSQNDIEQTVEVNGTKEEEKPKKDKKSKKSKKSKKQ